MATIDLTVMKDTELRKALRIPFLSDAVKEELSRREENKDALRLEASREAAITAGYPSLADGFTFSDGTTMDFLSLVDFVQRTLAVCDTDPKAVWESTLEARTALGDYKVEGLSKWKSLNALKGATE
jgi:hypothetical protein